MFDNTGKKLQNNLSFPSPSLSLSPSPSFTFGAWVDCVFYKHQANHSHFHLQVLIFFFSHCFRKFGAQGSRLTGAGWGGCTVSIVPADKLPSFLANVYEAYYQRSNRSLAPEKQSLFATKPGGGALVFLEA